MTYNILIFKPNANEMRIYLGINTHRVNISELFIQVSGKLLDLHMHT